jgi:hypothetical protein
MTLRHWCDTKDARRGRVQHTVERSGCGSDLTISARYRGHTAWRTPVPAFLILPFRTLARLTRQGLYRREGGPRWTLGKQHHRAVEADAVSRPVKGTVRASNRAGHSDEPARNCAWLDEATTIVF